MPLKTLQPPHIHIHIHHLTVKGNSVTEKRASKLYNFVKHMSNERQEFVPSVLKWHTCWLWKILLWQTTKDKLRGRNVERKRRAYGNFSLLFFYSSLPFYFPTNKKECNKFVKEINGKNVDSLFAITYFSYTTTYV